jgi:hypothetical protein
MFWNWIRYHPRVRQWKGAYSPLCYLPMTEPDHYKRLNLGGGQAYARSSD